MRPVRCTARDQHWQYHRRRRAAALPRGALPNPNPNPNPDPDPNPNPNPNSKPKPKPNQVLAAGWPAALLRGFRKTTPIAPGDLVDVPFCLTARDLSFYRGGGWVRAAAATAHFGASAGDLRASLSLRLPLDQLGEMAGAGAK